MSRSERPNHHRDPLLAELDRFKEERSRSSREVETEESRPSRRGFLPVFLSLILVVVLSGMGYYLYQAQERIEALTGQLGESRQELTVVSADLEDSKSRLSELHTGLDQSEQKISSQSQELQRYRGLYQGLKSEQEQQVRELQQLEVKKANQAEVNDLRGTTTQIQTRLETTAGELGQAKESITQLDQRTSSHQDALSRHDEEIESVRTASLQNKEGIEEIRTSLEREYYNFELVEGSGYLKVFDISVSLKDTDAARRECDLYLLADGKVIRKRNQPINEPIQFYVEGKTKPYELVITRVDKKLVVGYLSVPKV